jgi:hypothetical protein
MVPYLCAVIVHVDALLKILLAGSVAKQEM